MFFKRLLLLLATLLTFIIYTQAKTKWFELETYDFEKYQQEFGKVYTNQPEKETRAEIFYKNLAEIKLHNKDETKSYKKGVNQFTDRTVEEFRKVLGYKKTFTNKPRSDLNVEFNTEIPRNFDWRTFGVVSAVKDQGQCGSCWSFASAETIESAFAIKTGQLPVLSEQQILDCTENPNHCGGSGGCGGGTAELAYDVIMKMGGLSSEWTYPYLSYHGKNFECQFNKTLTPPVTSISGYKSLPSNVLNYTLFGLMSQGPLAVSVDASTWHSYETGVFDECNQVNPDLNHLVQLVGFGTNENHGPYWIVRNSWGTAYGMEGYIHLKREMSQDEVKCGTDLHPADGDGCDGGPATVTVCGTCGILYDNVVAIV